MLDISFLPVETVDGELSDIESEKGACGSNFMDSLEEEDTEVRTSAWIRSMSGNAQSQEILSEVLSELMSQVRMP